MAEYDELAEQKRDTARDRKLLFTHHNFNKAPSRTTIDLTMEAIAIKVGQKSAGVFSIRRMKGPSSQNMNRYLFPEVVRAMPSERYELYFLPQ